MKNTDSLSTTHFQIFDYWKDKAICRNGNIINVDEVEDFDEQIVIIEDDYEPICFGCGKPIIGYYEKEDKIPTDTKDSWNNKKVKSKLDRCHIVPRALGGGVEPSNLFLMCHDCHFLSPDTTNVSAFFRWVYKTRKEHVCGIPHPAILMGKIEDELEMRGLPNIETLLKSIPEEKAKEFMSGGYREWFDKNVGLHATHLVESSYVVGMTDYLLSEVKKCGSQVV